MRKRHDHEGSDEPGHGPESSHGHHLDAAGLMERAAAYASLHRLTVTRMRSEVLALLAQEHKPLTAYEIAERLSVGRKVQAVQVYRALDFLQDAGCVHRLASRSSYFACDHVHAAGGAVVFMVCSDCGSVAEAPSDTIARGLEGVAQAAGFKPKTPILEIEGQCPNCASAHG